jgi:hypothetical protein
MSRWLFPAEKHQIAGRNEHDAVEERLMHQRRMSALLMAK